MTWKGGNEVFFTRRAIYGVWFGYFDDIITEGGSHPDTSTTELPLFVSDMQEKNGETIKAQWTRCEPLCVSPCQRCCELNEIGREGLSLVS